MTVTLATLSGDFIVQPTLVLGIEWSRTINNIRHDIIGASAPSITFVTASLRTGTLNFLCATEGEAAQIEAFHLIPDTLVFSDDEHAYTSIIYVPVGTARMSLDPQTRSLWLYSVDFAEVQVADLQASSLRVLGTDVSAVQA